MTITYGIKMLNKTWVKFIFRLFTIPCHEVTQAWTKPAELWLFDKNIAMQAKQPSRDNIITYSVDLI